MTSDKQADANRRNARKSTGPKTPEGKAVARLNAVKHGLLSQEVLLPGEDESALERFANRVVLCKSVAHGHLLEGAKDQGSCSGR